jgi:hypothetical protein
LVGCYLRRNGGKKEMCARRAAAAVLGWFCCWLLFLCLLLLLSSFVCMRGLLGCSDIKIVTWGLQNVVLVVGLALPPRPIKSLLPLYNTRRVKSHRAFACFPRPDPLVVWEDVAGSCVDGERSRASIHTYAHTRSRSPPPYSTSSSSSSSIKEWIQNSRDGGGGHPRTRLRRRLLLLLLPPSCYGLPISPCTPCLFFLF